MYDSVQQFLQTQKRTLVSVFPMEHRKTCRLGTLNKHIDEKGNAVVRLGGFTTYVLDAAPKGGYTTLTVTGATDIGIDYTAEPPQPLPRPVDANSIAEYLKTEFTTSTLRASSEMGPGVWVAEEPEPTREQVLNSSAYKEALRKQEEYFRALIYDGDTLTSKGQPVTNLHRVAAKWMGAEDRPWVKEISERRTKICPACGESILSAAVVCRHCQTNLVEFAIANGAPDKEADPVVWQRIQTRLAKPETKSKAA